MRPLVAKIKPAHGFSELLHIGLVAIVPALVLIFVRIDFAQIALAIILLSKWRMFAVRPRFWPAIVRANSVDIIVGVAAVIFMQHSHALSLQLMYMVLYELWLLLLKPASGIVLVSAQAFIGQLVGLSAIFVAWGGAPLAWLVFAAALVCYLSARHFFDSFDEPYSKMLAYLWGYFSGGLLWVLGHWLLFYGPVAQPVLILTTVGYSLAALYYFDHTGRLSPLLRRQFMFIMLAIIIVIIKFSDWGDKVV